MIVCFDIGGTAIKGALATSPEDIRPFPRQPTPIHDFDAFVATLASVIAEAEAIAGERAACIAISIAGVIDPDTANAVVANIPCIHGRPLQADLDFLVRRDRMIGMGIAVLQHVDAGLSGKSVRQCRRGSSRHHGHRARLGLTNGGRCASQRHTPSRPKNQRAARCRAPRRRPAAPDRRARSAGCGRWSRRVPAPAAGSRCAWRGRWRARSAATSRAGRPGRTRAAPARPACAGQPAAS